MVDKKLNILIVEDEVIIAKHIEEHLLTHGYQIAGVVHDSETALDKIYTQSPDFIILDINIDGTRDGIEIAELVNEKYDIPFMFLTALSDLHTLDRAKKVNPCAYIVKPFKERDLVSNITIGLFNYQNRKQNREVTLEKVNAIALDPITRKEFEVLQDIIQGFTNNQIAKKQFVSLSAIKFHCQNIYSKMDVKNRSTLINKILTIG